MKKITVRLTNQPYYRLLLIATVTGTSTGTKTVVADVAVNAVYCLFSCVFILLLIGFNSFFISLREIKQQQQQQRSFLNSIVQLNRFIPLCVCRFFYVSVHELTTLLLLLLFTVHSIIFYIFNFCFGLFYYFFAFS